MVAYLKKSTGSEAFQEIVDFLNGSHIRYALTKNLTIYVSLIKKFWQTALVRTVNNGEQEITAKVDVKEFIVIKASVRRHLQLADVDGISVLPNTKIFDQLSLMGSFSHIFRNIYNEVTLPDNISLRPYLGVLQPQPPPSTAQPTNEEPIPNVVSSSHQKTQIPRQALNKVIELPHTSRPIPNVTYEAVYEEWDDRVERVVTTAASLDAEQASGNINRAQSTTMPNVPLPQGISAGGSLRCQKAMGVPLLRLGVKDCSRFGDYKIEIKSQEARKEEKSRTLQPIKRRLFKVRVESSIEENLDEDGPFKQGRRFYKVQLLLYRLVLKGRHIVKKINLKITWEFLVRLRYLQMQLKNVQTYTKRIREVSTGSGGISTASRLFSTAEESVSTGGASMPVSTAAVRLQEELDEEERQRMARVHEAAQSFTEQEWENIRARVKADEELTQRLQAEERSSKRAAEAELDYEGSKRQKTNEASGSVREQPDEEEK
nr:hypothetical protein [Tanacetum cinerariifolium]